MKNLHYPRLSFFESMYLWLYLYTSKSRFLTGRGSPEGAASVNLAFLQAFNFVVIWRSIIIVFNLNVTYSIWIDAGVFVVFTLFNTIVYEKRLDNIVERHNALPENKRLRNRTRMWVYVVVSLATMIGLMIYVYTTKETDKIPPAKAKHEILKIRGNVEK